MPYINKSPWVIHYGGSGCGGCDDRAKACFSPAYGIKKHGFSCTQNPKHADVFLVTGPVNERNEDAIKQIYEQMAEPKVVVAVGECTGSGDAGLDVPVDVRVTGCAAKPEAIIEGLIKGAEVLGAKNRKS